MLWCRGPVGSRLCAFAQLCCSCLSQFTRTELAEAARLCELYIGTMGGGMDQAISCLAEVGKAQHIQFDPLRAHPVSIPDGGVCVVANSLVEASKVILCACDALCM